jgi:hypothetical protein
MPNPTPRGGRESSPGNPYGADGAASNAEGRQNQSASVLEQAPPDQFSFVT